MALVVSGRSWGGMCPGREEFTEALRLNPFSLTPILLLDVPGTLGVCRGPDGAFELGDASPPQHRGSHRAGQDLLRSATADDR